MRCEFGGLVFGWAYTWRNFGILRYLLNRDDV